MKRIYVMIPRKKCVYATQRNTMLNLVIVSLILKRDIALRFILRRPLMSLVIPLRSLVRKQNRLLYVLFSRYVSRALIRPLLYSALLSILLWALLRLIPWYARSLKLVYVLICRLLPIAWVLINLLDEVIRRLLVVVNWPAHSVSPQICLKRNVLLIIQLNNRVTLVCPNRLRRKLKAKEEVGKLRIRCIRTFRLKRSYVPLRLFNKA